MTAVPVAKNSSLSRKKNPDQPTRSGMEWLKIRADIFEDPKIRFIESQTTVRGPEIILFWFKLLCFAAKHSPDGKLVISESVPVTLPMLSTTLYCDEKFVTESIGIFLKMKMVDAIETENGIIYAITNWSSHQNTDYIDKIKEQTRLRKRRYDERRKLLAKKDKSIENGNDTNSVTVTAQVTLPTVTSTPLGNVTVTNESVTEDVTVTPKRREERDEEKKLQSPPSPPSGVCDERIVTPAKNSEETPSSPLMFPVNSSDEESEKEKLILSSPSAERGKRKKNTSKGEEEYFACDENYPIPEDIPLTRESWIMWWKYRKSEKKNPVGESSAKALFSVLRKHHRNGHDPNELLEMAMANGWLGVYPPRESSGRSGGGISTINDKIRSNLSAAKNEAIEKLSRKNELHSEITI